jgi:hypothetical protein
MVAEPPELEVELPEAPEVELELLEPHAATISAATIAIAPALMRRLVNVISFSIWRERRISERVSGPRPTRVLTTCESPVRDLRALWGEPIAEAEVGVDESPSRERLLELDPQPADVNVDRAISRAHLPSPREAKQLLPSHDPVSPARELRQEVKLPNREHQGPASGPCDVLLRQDLKWTYLEDLGGG